MQNNTLGGKEKSFLWSYDGERIVIRKKINGVRKESEISYLNNELEKIMLYIKQGERISLANNVAKLKNGTEKEGIGHYIYNYLERKIDKAQSASQLVAIMVKANVLGYNEAKKNMEFWINDMNWRERMLNYVK